MAVSMSSLSRSMVVERWMMGEDGMGGFQLPGNTVSRSKAGETSRPWLRASGCGLRTSSAQQRHILGGDR
jgi:hypothetical protein